MTVVDFTFDLNFLVIININSPGPPIIKLTVKAPLKCLTVCHDLNYYYYCCCLATIKHCRLNYSVAGAWTDAGSQRLESILQRGKTYQDIGIHHHFQSLPILANLCLSFACDLNEPL